MTSSSTLDLPQVSSGAQKRLDLLQDVAALLGTDDPFDFSRFGFIFFEQHVASWHGVFEAQEKEEESAVMLERRKENLVRKAKEYHEELKTILKSMPEAPHITVTRLQEQEKKNKAKEQELRAKRVKIKAFKGLPPVSRHIL
ncbi:hypothetical protein C0995_013227 [Termitomyces sp. Mi166|nr:hypothetical protein C0995_013227 [Termitomyces sp. Mi166\